MSGTITRKPTYLLARERVDDLLEAARSKDLTDNIKHESKAIKPPLKDLAYGPAWLDGNGQEKRLSEFEDEIEHVSLGILEESTERVIIEVCYKGRFGYCTKIIERYEVSSEGIQYGVELDNKTIKPHLTVPLIKTDGDVKSDLNVLANGFQLTYRNVIYTVTSSDANEVFVSDEPASANRNAIYRTGIIKGTRAKMIFNTYV